MGFVEFARSHGLLIDSVVPDGRIHRVPTEEKPRKRNGSLRYTGDWGWVCNFNRSDIAIVWRGEGAERPFQPRAARVPPSVQRVMADEAARRARAAQKAAEIIQSCRLSTHPYLERKGFDGVKTLVDPQDRIVVPMRHFADARRLQSVQFIDTEGAKKFLPGGAAAEAVHTMGPLGVAETWLVEGYATGITVAAGLDLLHRRARVMVCFSAGNLARVGKQLRGFVRVVADNDESRAGEEAARATGHPWVMPEEVGLDANDVFARYGANDVLQLLRSVL